MLYEDYKKKMGITGTPVEPEKPVEVPVERPNELPVQPTVETPVEVVTPSVEPRRGRPPKVEQPVEKPEEV